MKIEDLKEKLNSLKEVATDLSKADDPLFDDPENMDDEEDDLAAKFLRGEDISQQIKEKGGSKAQQERQEFDLQNNPDHLSLMQDIAHHWVKQSEDRRLMRADALSNPVLASEGHRVSAANKVGESFAKDLGSHMNENGLDDMDHLDHLESLHNFEKDWHEKNPDYLKDALHSLSESHGKKADIHEAYNAEQDARDAHIMLGGAASGGIGGGAVADQAGSLAEGIQQAGGAIDKDTGATSASIETDPMTSFASSNQDFLSGERGKFSDDELRQKASQVVTAPDAAEEIVHNHPLLDEHKQTINDFFTQHNKTIGGTIKSVMNRAKEAGLPDSALDAGALREIGMYGLMQAVSSYDPSSETKFETYASNKMSGMMQTHLNNQNPVPRRTRQKAAAFSAKQKVEQNQPDLAPSTPEAPSQEAPKPDLKSKLGEDRHNRLKQYEAAKVMRKPKTEE